MKRIHPLRISAVLALVLTIMSTACKKDPYKDVVSHERSIEAFSLGEGLVQVGPAQVDHATATVSVSVLMQEGTDLSRVTPIVQQSYRSTVSPASGEAVDFAANGNSYTYTVTAESGESREWTVALTLFEESILGAYSVQRFVVYGGTGPEYGGGAVMDMTDKPWLWPEADGPQAEYDNTLQFEFIGVTDDGNTYGTFINDAGVDGSYANFLYVANPQTDLNPLYRKIPTEQGTWERDYTANTITFTFADGTTSVGEFVGAGTQDLGNGLSKQITDHSLTFSLTGSDDWDNIYSDYDKFVKRPRRLWIDIQKID